MRKTILVLLAESGLSVPLVASGQFVVQTPSNLWTSGSPSPSQGSTTYGYSDCQTTGAIGLVNGGELAWFQGFDTQSHGGATDLIVEIASFNGQGGGSGAPAGTVGGVYLYDDPGGDWTDPTDLGAGDLRAEESWVTCCPNSNTKEPVELSTPDSVSGGFWVVASLPHVPGEYPGPMDTDTAPSMERSWLTGVEGGEFDPMNPGAGVGFFSMQALGFDSHWVMTAEGMAGGPPRAYCTAKAGLSCGEPSMDFTGVPRADKPSGFLVRAAPARGQRAGLLLYSCTGRLALPFDGGFLCVAPPIHRTSVVDSGGTAGQCDGVFELDWNSFASGNAGGNPDPCIAVSGQQVNVQLWGRDAVMTGAS